MLNVVTNIQVSKLGNKTVCSNFHYYSPKSYDFVCKVLALPHSSSLCFQAASVNCEPGFLCNIIKVLGGMVQNPQLLMWVFLLMQCLCTKPPGGIAKNGAMLEQWIMVQACLKLKISWLLRLYALCLVAFQVIENILFHIFCKIRFLQKFWLNLSKIVLVFFMLNVLMSWH